MNRIIAVLLAFTAIAGPTSSTIAAEIHLIEGDLEIDIQALEARSIKLPQSPRSASVVFRGKFELFDSVKLKNALRDAKDRHPGETVYLYIDSPGGAYNEALKILDLMEEFRKHTPIVTVACGPGAFSAGAMIWLGGTECQIIGGSVVGFHAPYYSESSSTTPELVENVRERMMRDASRLPAFREYAQDMADYVGSLFAQQGPAGFLVAYIDWKKKRLELDMWTPKELAELPQRWLTGYDEAWDTYLTTSVSAPYIGCQRRKTYKSLGLPFPSDYLKTKKLVKEDVPPISVFSVTFTEEDDRPKFGKTEVDSHVFLNDDATSLRPLFAWHFHYGAAGAFSHVPLAGGRETTLSLWMLTFLDESWQDDSQLIRYEPGGGGVLEEGSP